MNRVFYYIALLFILLGLGGCATPYNADRQSLPNLSEPNPLQPDIYNYRNVKYHKCR